MLYLNRNVSCLYRFPSLIINSFSLRYKWLYRSENTCNRAFLVGDNRILNLNRPLGRSLRSFARTAHSASLRLLRSLTLFTGLLTHFAHSLMGELNMCSRCKRVQWAQTRFWSSLETRPTCNNVKKQVMNLCSA